MWLSSVALDADRCPCRRARHLQQQRDLLIAKKKAERDARAAASGKANSAQQAESDSKPSSFASPAKASKDTAEDRGANHMRANMHMALARRMKIDLMESEEAKLAEAQVSGSVLNCVLYVRAL